MTTTKPAEKITTCDACGRNVERHNRYDAHWLIRQNALDYLNQPAADASINLDFCDECHTRLSKEFNEYLARLQEKHGYKEP